MKTSARVRVQWKTGGHARIWPAPGRRARAIFTFKPQLPRGTGGTTDTQPLTSYKDLDSLCPHTQEPNAIPHGLTILYPTGVGTACSLYTCLLIAASTMHIGEHIGESNSYLTQASSPQA